VCLVWLEGTEKLTTLKAHDVREHETALDTDTDVAQNEFVAIQIERSSLRTNKLLLLHTVWYLTNPQRNTLAVQKLNFYLRLIELPW
jgi:hypothetical protein